MFPIPLDTTSTTGYPDTVPKTKNGRADKIVKMFEKCDVNRSGFIEREDMMNSFPDLSARDIDDIFDHIDSDKDGLISLTEFARAYQERESLIIASPSKQSKSEQGVIGENTASLQLVDSSAFRLSNRRHRRSGENQCEKMNPTVENAITSANNSSALPPTDLNYEGNNSLTKASTGTTGTLLYHGKQRERSASSFMGQSYAVPVATATESHYNKLARGRKSEIPKSLTSSYKKSMFRSMKPSKNSPSPSPPSVNTKPSASKIRTHMDSPLLPVTDEGTDSNASNFPVSPIPQQPGDTLTQSDEEEMAHRHKTTKRRPSLQTGMDPTQIEELRTIENQKKIFMETLNEIPCESEIYRLYDIISNPDAFSSFPNTSTTAKTANHSAENAGTGIPHTESGRKGSIRSPVPLNLEAKHLFEDIIFKVITNYREKKANLEKYETLLREKTSECDELAKKLSEVEIVAKDNFTGSNIKNLQNVRPSQSTHEENDPRVDDGTQLVLNRFSTSLKPKYIDLSPHLGNNSTNPRKRWDSEESGQGVDGYDSDQTSNLSRSMRQKYIMERHDILRGTRKDSFTQTADTSLGDIDSQPNRKKNMTIPRINTKMTRQVPPLKITPPRQNSEEFYLNSRPSDRIFNVILAGDASVGKTSILIQFCENRFEQDLQTTLGIDCVTKSLLYDKLKVSLKIWDTVGQERFRSLTQSYFRRADGILLVYDSSHETSLINIRYWLTSIKESSTKKDVAIVICANKCDIVPSNQDVYTLNSLALDIANENEAPFWQTSAKTGKNIENAFRSLIKLMIEREDRELFRAATINLKPPKTSTSIVGRCCE